MSYSGGAPIAKPTPRRRPRPLAVATYALIALSAVFMWLAGSSLAWGGPQNWSEGPSTAPAATWTARIQTVVVPITVTPTNPVPRATVSREPYLSPTPTLTATPPFGNDDIKERNP